MKRLFSILHPPQARKLLSNRGVSGYIIFFIAFIMSFVASYTMQIGGAAGRFAKEWQTTLSTSASLILDLPTEELENAFPIAQNILDTTPGIVHYERLDRETQFELLEPWLGDAIPKDVLPLPGIINVEIDKNQFQEETLVARLAAELPGAVFDNHERWRGDFIARAQQIKGLSWISALLIFTGLFLTMSVAVYAMLYSNRTNLQLMLELGATREWLRLGIFWRVGANAVFGAFWGAFLGVLITRLILGEAGAVFGALRQPILLTIFVLVVLNFVFSYLATIFTVKRFLSNLQEMR